MSSTSTIYRSQILLFNECTLNRVFRSVSTYTWVLAPALSGAVLSSAVCRAAALTLFAFPSWLLSDSSSGCKSASRAQWKELPGTAAPLGHIDPLLCPVNEPLCAQSRENLPRILSCLGTFQVWRMRRSIIINSVLTQFRDLLGTNSVLQSPSKTSSKLLQWYQLYRLLWQMTPPIWYDITI